jgi:predicted HTH transcriptional regulator
LGFPRREKESSRYQKKTSIEEEWGSGLERIVEAVEKNLNMTLIFDLVGMKRRQ